MASDFAESLPGNLVSCYIYLTVPYAQTSLKPIGPMNTPQTPTPKSPVTAEAPPSYVKLAMRNMVRKGGKSLFHFTLSAIGLLGLLVGLAYLTR